MAREETQWFVAVKLQQACGSKQQARKITRPVAFFGHSKQLSCQVHFRVPALALTSVVRDSVAVLLLSCHNQRMYWHVWPSHDRNNSGFVARVPSWHLMSPRQRSTGAARSEGLWLTLR